MTGIEPFLVISPFVLAALSAAIWLHNRRTLDPLVEEAEQQLDQLEAELDSLNADVKAFGAQVDAITRSGPPSGLGVVASDDELNSFLADIGADPLPKPNPLLDRAFPNPSYEE